VPMKLRLVPRDPNNPGPTDRRRILVLLRELRGKGVDVDLLGGVEEADVLVTNSEDFGRWLPVARRVRSRGGHVLYDVTDDVLSSRQSRTYREGRGAWGGLLRMAKDKVKDLVGHPRSFRKAEDFWTLCSGIVTGSESQAQSFRERFPGKPVCALVDPVDLEEYRPLATHGPREGIRVVWEGTSHNVPYLGECAEALRALMKEGRIRLRVVTDRQRTVPWKGLTDNVEVLRSLGLSEAEFCDWSLQTFALKLSEGDVGIAPLYSEDPFCRAKPANKILGYAALRLPVVCSAIPSYRSAMEEGRFGFLAGASRDWTDALTRLASDADLRREMGERGRAYVESGFTVSRFAERYWEFVRSIVG
jgi:glycosyltransferase involved in cell wall biosynthesis